MLCFRHAVPCILVKFSHFCLLVHVIIRLVAENIPVVSLEDKTDYFVYDSSESNHPHCAEVINLCS